jgi:ribosome-interacting GTPase 1
LVDTPPLDREFVELQLMDLIRRSDLILLVVDLLTDPIQHLEGSVALLEEHRILPRSLRDRYPEPRRLTFIPMLVVANKYDDEGMDENLEIFRTLLEDDWPLVAVSATTGRNLEQLKRMVFDRLEVVRVYTKVPGKEPDLATPFVLKEGDTVQFLARKIHKDFVENLKTARVWGKALYDGQMVSRDYVLHDGDIVELHV